MVTVLNVVLVIMAVILPKWFSLASVIASAFIPDAIPVIDELIAVGFLIRKFFKVPKDAEGKAVVYHVRDEIKSTTPKQLVDGIVEMKQIDAFNKKEENK